MSEKKAAFEVEHLVTFVESEYALKPEEIMQEVLNFESSCVIPTHSRIEMNSTGVTVSRIDKNEVIERAPWNRVYDHGVILPEDGNSLNKNLLIFRIKLTSADFLGYQNELLVFGIESEGKGRTILERILYFKEKTNGNANANKTTADVPKSGTVRRKTQHKRRSVASVYRSTVYMLSNCLDDIERFGKRLNRCVKFDEYSGSYTLSSDKHHVPNHMDLTECVRKTKFALNLNQEFQKDAPEASQKIFVRLIKITRWLDEICQSKVIPDYDTNLVRDVVEPLLNPETIQSILSISPGDLKTFWETLGPPWNTPSLEWPNSLSTYVPEFHTTSKEKTNVRITQELLERYLDMDDAEPPFRSQNREEPARHKMVTKATRPKFRNKDHERFYLKVQERGGRLCYATVRHVDSNQAELHVFPSEVLELLDEVNEDWWLVENYSGETGQVPRWKLHEFYLDSSMINIKTADYQNQSDAPMLQPFSPSVSRLDSVVLPPDFVTAPPSLKANTSFRSISSPRTEGTFVSGHPEPGSLVLYLLPEQIEMMKKQPSNLPIVLMPYGTHSSSTARVSTSIRPPPNTYTQPRYVRSTLLSSGRWCPPALGPVVRYKPTIVLD